MFSKKKNWFKNQGVGGYLLDKYPNGVACFSLRKLKSDVIYVCLISRLSDSVNAKIIAYDNGDSVDMNSTLDIGGTLNDFVIGSDSVIVRFWYDQSGNGNHVTATLAKCPFLVENGVLITKNGLTSLRYVGTGAGDGLALVPPPSELNSGNDITIFGVAYTEASNSLGGIMSTSQTNRLTMFVDRRTIKRNTYIYSSITNGYVNIQNTDNTDNLRVQSVIIDGTSKGLSGWKDAESESIGVPFEGDYTNDILMIGSTANYLTGGISECLIFSTKHPSRAEIHENINSHYSIY